ncbi:hypothetical protein ES703_94116 [subsurface metagenome]
MLTTAITIVVATLCVVVAVYLLYWRCHSQKVLAMPKTTPSNCHFPDCKYNLIPPGVDSQECVGCDGNDPPEPEPEKEGCLL